MGTPQNPDFDYIVIGSGAGGGPVASHLAAAGFKVGLIEAGQSPEPPCYSVPVFHSFASEDPDLSWEYFVKHYSDETQSKRDIKYDANEDGVFYPRAGTLGGCTAHNAMIASTTRPSTMEPIRGRVSLVDAGVVSAMKFSHLKWRRCGRGYQSDPSAARICRV